MKQFESISVSETSPDTAQKEMWLLGQPPLAGYLDFVKAFGVEDFGPLRGRLVQEWGDANDYYDELETREAGIADALECFALPESMRALAAQFMDSPRFRRSFNRLPTQIEMVRLDRLVLCQNHVNQRFVDQLKQRLGPSPTATALFEFCQPPEDSGPPVHMRQHGFHNYSFRCDSADLRLHEPVLLAPDQVQGYEPGVKVAGGVGVAVGLGSNCMNALRDADNGRMMLNNGYHRACALLELGITHAPCIVQTVSRRDELDISAKAHVARDAGYFFNGKRPPLLKDYADPRICKTFTVRKTSRIIEVKIEIRDFFVID